MQVITQISKLTKLQAHCNTCNKKVKHKRDIREAEKVLQGFYVKPTN